MTPGKLRLRSLGRGSKVPAGPAELFGSTGPAQTGTPTPDVPADRTRASGTETAKPSPVILLKMASKIYQVGPEELWALREVSMAVRKGDFLAIMGASGSGKSTMMNIIGCLDVPSRGRYLLDGVDVRHLYEDELAVVRNQKIGFVFQNFNLIPRTSAVQNVEMPLVYAGVRAAERRERALAALERVGLGDRVNHLPSELSGGQQQRVAVARAIVSDPAIILADEPTGNLDSSSTVEVMDVFSGLNAEGRTIVLITHEDEVAAFAKRVIQLRDGRIVLDRRRAQVDGPPPRIRAGAQRAVPAGSAQAAGGPSVVARGAGA